MNNFILYFTVLHMYIFKNIVRQVNHYGDNDFFSTNQVKIIGIFFVVLTPGFLWTQILMETQMLGERTK